MSDPVEALAQKVRTDPFFLAHILEAYAAAEGRDDAGLAADIGCNASELKMVRLCRTPREGPAEFREDVARVAEKFSADADRLTEVVRRGQVLLRLSGRTDTQGLMAARDKDTDQEQTP